MLIPNNKYYEIFKANRDEINDTEYTEITIKDNIRVGSFLLFRDISKKLNIEQILKDDFKNYKDILTIIFFMLTNSKAMIHIDDFCNDTKHFSKQALTSRMTSEIFKSINNQNKFNFFQSWVKQNKKDEYIAYDVTSLSSYAQNNDYVEWGYNRDGENLEQINIGTFYGEKSKLPIYYNNYSGSIVDKTYLGFMMQGAKELGLDVAKYVMDKGFHTHENLEYMHGLGLKFIVCAKENKAIRELVLSKMSDVNSPENYIISHETYGSSYDYDKYKIHVFFDARKLADQERVFYKNIDKYEKELRTLKTANKRILKKYKKYFDIRIGEDGRIAYDKDYDRINELHGLLGYFACISNDLDIKSEEIIDIYRNKDVVEKHFDNLKHYADGYRSRTHTTDTYDGKMFLMFICLIYKSHIENTCKEYIRKNKMTTDKVINELAKIKMIKINNKARLVQPLTKTQKELLKLFGLSDADIIKEVCKF